MQMLLLIVVWTLLAWLSYSGIRHLLHRRALKRMGDQQYATVVNVLGTGSYSGADPNLMVTLQYTDKDGVSHRRDITRLFSLANLPRRGDRMTVWVNPDDPSDFDVANDTPLPPGYNA